MAEADLPDPAGRPASPPLTAEPDGEVTAPASAPAALPGFGPCLNPLAASELRGEQVAVLCGRARTVEVHEGRRRVAAATAGIGPTAMVTDGKDATYVVDSLGEALLVYRRTPFQLIRRVHLGGAPYAIAFDRERWGLWITLNGTNQVVHYKAGWRPVLQDTYASIPGARSITAAGGAITVHGEGQSLRLRTK